MGDAAGQAAHGFHLLGLAELLFQGAALGDVLGKQFEEDGVGFVAEGASGEAHADDAAVPACPVGIEAVEFLQGAQVVGQAEPLLRIGIQVGQIASHQFRARGVAQHGHQRRIYVEQDAGGVAAAHAVGSMGDQGSKVDFGAAQSFLGGAQRGVKRTNQTGHEHEQRQMYDGAAVVGGIVRPGQREIRADGKGEGGSDQARLPTAVPGADHNGNREHHQAALHHVGEQEGRNQGKNNAENGDAVSEDWGPSRSDVAVAKKGELRSHELNLIPRMGWRELREYIQAALSGR